MAGRLLRREDEQQRLQIWVSWERFPFPITDWDTGHREEVLWEWKGTRCFMGEDLEIWRESLVWTWREPEHRTAGPWEHGCLWTSFHTSPFTVRCCQKRHFWWLCSAPQGLAFSEPYSQLQQREGVVGLLSFLCLQQQERQVDRSQLAQLDTALKGFKPTWPVPKEQQTLSRDYFSLISECRDAKLP